MKHANQIKKTLALFLSLVMLFSITAGMDLSAYAATSGDYEYTVLEDGTAAITKYKGNGGEVTIPSDMDGYAVTSIGEYAFSRCDSLTSIVIPDSVTHIGTYAFIECTNVTDLTIGQNVASIDEGAFFECTSLTSITIPKSVTNIGLQVFGACDSLIGFDVDPNNVEYSSEDGVLFEFYSEGRKGLVQYPTGNTRTEYIIPDYVVGMHSNSFSWNKYLTSVTIPDGVRSIGDEFNNCTGLKTVKIGNSVRYIDKSAFSGCDSLTSFEVSPDASYFSSLDGVLFSKKQKTLVKYPMGNTRKEYVIPDSVTSIDEEAFQLCTNLTNVTIGKNVESIGENAFLDCDSLESITVDSQNPYYSSQDGVLFSIDRTSQELIQYPIGNARTTYTIPERVTSIGIRAFNNCTSLTSVTISNSLKSIGESAFENCTNLTSVTISEKVESIGIEAFDGCTSITDVYYNSTIADWNSITIESYNKPLTNATIHCTDGIIEKPHIHTWNDGETTKSATCTELGETTYTCTACGETKTEPIEKAAHNYSTVVKTTAKVSREGKLAEECAVCGDVRSTTPIAKIKSLSLSTTTFTYNGKVKRPAVTVKDSNGEVIPSDYYTLTYSTGRKDVGKYQVAVKFKDRYTGTKNLYFRILPKATSISDIDVLKGGFIVKWNEVTSQTSGYQVQYSTSSKFASPKTYKITNPATTSKRVTGLESGKKYYVRVRTYQTVDGQRYFSKWSKTKAVIAE